MVLSFLNMIYRGVSSLSNCLSNVSVLRASWLLVLSAMEEAVMFVIGKVTSVADPFSSSPKIQLRQIQDNRSVVSKYICARSQSFLLFSAPLGQSCSQLAKAIPRGCLYLECNGHDPEQTERKFGGSKADTVQLAYMKEKGEQQDIVMNQKCNNRIQKSKILI